jgi:two-component system, cell cycle sensor histidine kinase and response regulator CckA
LHPLSPELSSFARTEPLWVRYTIAVTSSALALLLELQLNALFAAPVTPFLPGFAAVIASAAWAGFGAGILSTVLVTCWCALLLYAEHRHTAAGLIVRCALFAAEGVLLSIGSARLWRATRQVARREDWLRRIVETSAEGIWVTDSEGRITYANPRIAEILGAQVEDVTGLKAEEFFFPEDLSVERIRFQNLRAGLKEQYDRRLRRKDGGEAWVLTCSNPFLERPGEFRGVLAMMTDITERKRAEHGLRRSEERFRSLFENVLEGVYQSTRDGRIIAANPMLLRMLGLSNEAEMNDVNIAKDLYVDPTVRKRLLERLEQDGSFQNIEYQLRRRDGHVISVEENGRVVRDEEGRVLYYEGTLTEITERKRIEEQLRQAQKMEALGRLAGGIAHDFSNILTIISGYAHLVVSDLPAAHAARASAEQVVKAADSASGLTRQLLSFSRRQTAPHATVDLNHVLSLSKDSLRRALDEASGGQRVDLVVSTTREAVSVFADEGHLEQILLNLAINARNAMQSGGTLEVKTEVVDVEASFCRRYPGTRPGSYAAISFRDAGADRYSEKTVALFETTSAAGRAAAAGFGVGTTHAIVSQYGGFMVVNSPPDSPSVFSVYLPRAEQGEGIRPADFADAAMRGGSHETILLVDDEPLTRELNRDMLEAQGHEVFLASDAREAERVIERSVREPGVRFGLLIADLTMPQGSGPDLARRLRAIAPDLKVLFLSGDADRPSDRKAAGDRDAILSKPFSVDSMARTIRQIFDRR